MIKNDRVTVEDFGAQWQRDSDNSGFYGSLELFQDICGPLLSVDDLKNSKVLDIGSGAGRIVNMILDAGADHVIAIEPSNGIEAVKYNTRNRAEKVTYVQTTGENIPSDILVDYIFSIGVLQFIPNPEPAVRRANEILKPGGKFLFMVYGKEGNELYLAFITPLRKITRIMPDFMLALLSHTLNFLLSIYIFFCKFIPLPLHKCMTEVMAKVDKKKRFLTIFDQLNPTYSRYYTRNEAFELMKSAGFKNIQLYHRHSYCWTVIGEK